MWQSGVAADGRLLGDGRAGAERGVVDAEDKLLQVATSLAIQVAAHPQHVAVKEPHLDGGALREIASISRDMRERHRAYAMREIASLTCTRHVRDFVELTCHARDYIGGGPRHCRRRLVAPPLSRLHSQRVKLPIPALR